MCSKTILKSRKLGGIEEKTSLRSVLKEDLPRSSLFCVLGESFRGVGCGVGGTQIFRTDLKTLFSLNLCSTGKKNW